MEIKTEADSDDMTEGPHDDQPTTGMFGFCSVFIRNTVKQGRSLTHVVSPDEIQHVRSKSDVSGEGKKTFVAVSRLGKTDLVFLQPSVKMNRVYYCENVLEQGLMPAICCRPISNNEFVFQQNGVAAHRSHDTVAYLCSNVPEYIEPEN